MKTDTYLFGVFITLVGGILWGFSGASGQYLFEHKGITTDWLVPYRLLLSGFFLLGVYAIKNPSILFLPLKNKKNIPTLIFYGLIGLMLTQYSYFYGIELSNAAVATVIQYTAPVFILIVICLMEKRSPTFRELFALFLALFGVFLLATHFSLDSLAISQKALLFCFISALSVVVYNIAPKRLNSEFPISLILGWGLVIGGVALSLFVRVWELEGVRDLAGFLALLSIVFFGTILAFVFYLMGVKLIGATKASLIACIEPVSAAFFSHFWLGTTFVIYDYIGFAFIMFCVFILSKKA